MMSVHLTERGQQVVREVLPGHFQWMASLMRPLSEGERQTLVRLLAKIAQRAKVPKPWRPARPDPGTADFPSRAFSFRHNFIPSPPCSRKSSWSVSRWPRWSASSPASRSCRSAR